MKKSGNSKKKSLSVSINEQPTVHIIPPKEEAMDDDDEDSSDEETIDMADLLKPS